MILEHFFGVSYSELTHHDYWPSIDPPSCVTIKNFVNKLLCMIWPNFDTIKLPTTNAFKGPSPIRKIGQCYFNLRMEFNYRTWAKEILKFSAFERIRKFFEVKSERILERLRENLEKVAVEATRFRFLLKFQVELKDGIILNFKMQ